nr:hypothetical protein [Candidatus Sigynarchaeota archaeon]
MDKERDVAEEFHHWFSERRVERANLVPAPAALVVLLGAICGLAALASSSAVLVWLAIVPSLVAPVVVVTGSKQQCYHDAARDILAMRKHISWQLVAGFRVTRLPSNVDGNQRRLLRNLHGIGLATGVTFSILVSRHEFPRVAETRSAAWFEPGAPSKETLGAGESGHAWMLVLEKHVNLFKGIKRETADFAKARDATRSIFVNTYPHHGFAAMTAGELACAATW